ncbi:MAG TPA: hypothetical protein VF981_15380, partial [Gemmatimonadaceae bacterium]
MHGPAAGLARLGVLASDDRLQGHHRLDAVRAHLLEIAGDWAHCRYLLQRRDRDIRIEQPFHRVVLHSSLLTPHSSLLTLHSSLFTPHSSLFTPHSSLLERHG